MDCRKKYKEIDYNLMKKKVEMLTLEAENGMSRMSELERKVKSGKEEELFLEHKQVVLREWRHFVSYNVSAKDKLIDILRELENLNNKTENNFNVRKSSSNSSIKKR